jgi:hypothetical protein
MALLEQQIMALAVQILFYQPSLQQAAVEVAHLIAEL